VSWTDFLAIREEQRQLAEDERTAPLVDCPIDGERLVERNGVFNCPLGNFRTRNPLRHQAAVRS
jgi:hypothetical protein